MLYPVTHPCKKFPALLSAEVSLRIRAGVLDSLSESGTVVGLRASPWFCFSVSSNKSVGFVRGGFVFKSNIGTSEEDSSGDSIVRYSFY